MHELEFAATSTVSKNGIARRIEEGPLGGQTAAITLHPRKQIGPVFIAAYSIISLMIAASKLNLSFPFLGMGRRR